MGKIDLRGKVGLSEPKLVVIPYPFGKPASGIFIIKIGAFAYFLGFQCPMKPLQFPVALRMAGPDEGVPHLE